MSNFTTYADSAQAASTSTNPSTTTRAAAQKADGDSASGTAAGSSTAATQEDDAGGKKKKTTKRRKVNHACLYCRRSHMTCDEGRPCQRCIKREIGHLCHDERRPKPAEKQATTPVTAAPVTAAVPTISLTGPYAPLTIYPTPTVASAWPLTSTAPQQTFLYQPETFGNEFSVLTDFLETLDDGTFFTPPTTVVPSLMSSATFAPNPAVATGTATPAAAAAATATVQVTPTVGASTQAPVTAPLAYPPQASTTPAVQSQVSPEPASVTPSDTTSTAEDASKNGSAEAAAIILPAATKTEKFLLTAADQESGSRDERLNRVIRSKYEAGLLKPYNYVKGYARLSRWMDRNVSQESKQQILQPLSVLRPKFRAVAQSLRDLDLVFIEEAFERMLLDYDRVFSAMGVPACLWRRTGEIYKGNREFCELIGVDGAMMRDGRLCIYELMAEESAVNYWEKYGHVAFDSSQKAVLTSCVLRYKPNVNLILGLNPSTSPTTATSKGSSSTTGTTSSSSSSVQGSTATNGNGTVAVKTEEQPPQPTEEGFINCCFSFTIRRDKWGIPSMIVGNFIAC